MADVPSFGLPGPPPFPEGRWRGRFLWSAPPVVSTGTLLAGRIDPDAGQGFVCLRRSFDLDAVPACVPARFTADSRYVLSVNGIEVARGPVRANPRRLHYDALDLTPWLVRGRNVLSVLARWYGHPTPWWAPVPPTLQLGGGSFVFEARLGAGWLVSDDSWKALAPTAWGRQASGGVGGLSPECFDARSLPAGWREIAFDDGDWPAAVELRAHHVGFLGRHEPPVHPYGPLPPRPIAFLTGAEREATCCAHATADDVGGESDPVLRVREALSACVLATGVGDDGSVLARPREAQLLTFDFGEVVAGTALFEVEAPAGTVFDVALAELRDTDGRIDFDDQHSGFRYVARGHDDRFESFDGMGMRYAAVAVRGDGPVRVQRVAVRERLHPRPGGPYFTCSDARLDAIWAAGRRTVDLCSQDAYLDCPTREQRAWTGDAVVHGMVDLATNPDWRLARRNVVLAASPRPDGMLPMAVAGDVEHLDPTFIPDWALHWIRSLHNLWRWTGDGDLVARLLPVAEGVLGWFEGFRGRDGLLADVTGWVIIDWSSVAVAGRSSVLNALYARALRDFAEMADWLGDAGRAARARSRHAEVSDAFEIFWDEARGLYADCVRDGIRRPETSQHAQTTPIVAGVAPVSRWPRLLEATTDASRLVHATWSRAAGDARRPRRGERGVAGPYLVVGPPEPWWDVAREIVRAQPFYRYVVHDAFAEAGRADRIPALCLDWMELLARCPTSLSETWYGGTTCHAWSATPTRDLVVRTLGISPAEPGFSVARVAPRLGGLEFARGAAPTPRGLLHVDARPDRVEIGSPVPVDVEVFDRPTARLPAGTHVLLPEGVRRGR